MGEHQNVTSSEDRERYQTFMKALLRDVRALETMLDQGRFEEGVRRIGAEQEMFLVDRAGHPAPVAAEVLDRLHHPQFTTELARFNLEVNLSPTAFGGKCLSRMERELEALLEEARRAARACGAEVLLVGILPTLRLEDLGLENMTANPRYLALNNAMRKLRGGVFQFRIKGLDELDVTHDNVMVEACNTSFQCHFQVGHREFARLYNVAQAIAGPVMAAAVNSPLLLGKRLWQETRVALFQQSVDARSALLQARGHRPRVHFGDRWIENSVLEIFREDIARYRVVLAGRTDEDPEQVLARGGVPELTALRLHNGTVYRWNRACYGILDGKPHLRIEHRTLPSGPTVADEIANAAFFFGLMSALVEEYGDVRRVMEFDHAKDNFLSAARKGLQAQFTWIGGESRPASELILEHLLPLARQGLRAAEVDAGDADRFLGILEDRVRSGMTGARWQLDSLAALAGGGTMHQRLRALTSATIRRQESGRPVHTWELAKAQDAEDWRGSYRTVGQFMTTDLFTVRPQDVVDLAASLMEWEHIRHVPVEDDEGRLVGLVSHRALLRLIGSGLGAEASRPVAVEQIMKRDPVTVTPETPTLEAIELMRKHKVGCLPVVNGESLVGIVTERDLIEVAATLLEESLRE